MSLSLDGTTLIFTGTVTITNATDFSTGVTTLMLTPDGGVGNIPALLEGAPGQSALFDSVTVSTLNAGASATASIAQISPGASGVSSHYSLALGIPQGEPGVAGATSILAATDLENSPTDTYIIAYDAANTAVQFVPQLVGPLVVPATIASTSGASSSRVLCSLTVVPQPYNWRPLVYGHCVVTGTANTNVHLIARINDSAAGDVVGFCSGLPGTDRPILTPAFDSTLGASYGEVLAGNSANIYFLAEQVNTGTTDSWTTNSGTTTFTLEVKPVQPV